jgi:diphosphomevalonate decarboxylase
MKEIIEMIQYYFPQTPDAFKDAFGIQPLAQGKLVEGFNENVAKRFGVGAVKGLIHTKVGDGPRKREESESLLGANGMPKSLM